MVLTIVEQHLLLYLMLQITVTVFSGSVGNVVFDVGTFGSLDVSGDVDVDGTLEADAMTLNGTELQQQQRYQLVYQMVMFWLQMQT